VGNNGVKGCVGTMVLKAFNGVKGLKALSKLCVGPFPIVAINRNDW